MIANLWIANEFRLAVRFGWRTISWTLWVILRVRGWSVKGTFVLLLNYVTFESIDSLINLFLCLVYYCFSSINTKMLKLQTKTNLFFGLTSLILI